MRRGLFCGLIAVFLLGNVAGCGWMRRVLRLKRRRTRIKNVPAMEVGTGWDSMLRGMEILLRHRGEKASLNELMAYSGDAFNLPHASHWDGGVHHLFIPTDTLGNVARAYGYHCRWLLGGWPHEMKRLDEKERRGKSDEFVGQICRQIDAGRPVLMGGTHGYCGNWSVVVGYDRRKWRMCTVGGKNAYEWADFVDSKAARLGFWEAQVRGAVRPDFVGGWQANAAFLLTEKAARPPEKDTTRAVLKRAVELFRAPQRRYWGGAPCYFGQEAYQQWARELRELDYPADLSRPRPKGAADWYSMDNIDFQVDCIVRGRPAAAEFCRKRAALLPKAKPHLAAAARLYGEEVAIAKEAFAPFIPPVNAKDAPRVAWLSDRTRRQGGADALAKMLEKERAAVAEIEKALTLLK